MSRVWHRTEDLESSVFEKIKTEHPQENPIKVRDLAGHFGVARRRMSVLLSGLYKRSPYIFARKRKPMGVYYHVCRDMDSRIVHLSTRTAVIEEMARHINDVFPRIKIKGENEYKIHRPIGTELTEENRPWILAAFLKKHCFGLANAKPLSVLPDYGIDLSQREALSVVAQLRAYHKFPVFSLRKGRQGAGIFWAANDDELKYGKRIYGKILQAYKENFHSDNNPVIARELEKLNGGRKKIA